MHKTGSTILSQVFGNGEQDAPEMVTQDNGLEKQRFSSNPSHFLTLVYPVPLNSYILLSTKQRLTPFFLQVMTNIF